MKFITKIFLLIFFLTCSTQIFAAEKDFSIACSLFPVYDFARAVADDSANINLLLRPGAEPHEFEPSPLDIKFLNDSDVFVFAGRYMEQWAEKISRSLRDIEIVDASNGIEIFNGDPHIWLDLSNAQIMIKNIAAGFSNARPDRAEIFNRNAEEYCRKIAELDSNFSELAQKNKNKILVFAGEFAFGYFMRRYGFDYISAYDGENEPSIKKMAEILNFINENHVKFIFSTPNISAVTRSIAEQTGTEILIFNSAESISQKDFDAGLTFLEIMQANYESLKKFIND